MTDRDAAVKRALEGAVRSGTGGWVVAPCPFCAGRLGNARRRCFGILEEHGIYRCFRCGIKGRLDGYTAEIKPREVRSLKDVSVAKPEGFTPLYGDQSYCLAPARQYLEKRGIPPELVKQAGLGACAWGYYAGRIIVPVLDQEDKSWLGFAARSWLPSEQVEIPYLYPASMLKGQLMYNMSALYNETAPFLLVVEGSFDTLALMQRCNASAFLGKPSHFQEDLLVECPLPIICLLDGDAWRESEALMWRLQMRGKKAGWIKIPPAEDPHSIGVDWVLDRAKFAL